MRRKKMNNNNKREALENCLFVEKSIVSLVERKMKKKITKIFSCLMLYAI